MPDPRGDDWITDVTAWVNDVFLAGSQGALWHDLDRSERDHWLRIARANQNTLAVAPRIAALQAERDALLDALRLIAESEVEQRNPDGDDQAAHTMKLIATEALTGERGALPDWREDADRLAEALLTIVGATDHEGGDRDREAVLGVVAAALAAHAALSSAAHREGNER